MWQHTSIPHSRISSIELFVRESYGSIELTVAYNKKNRPTVCPIADRLIGDISQIVFDQEQTPVKWVEAELPSACLHPQLDMRISRQRNGHQDTLDFLKYHLANAINAGFEDRGFSRFLKKSLIGTWRNVGAQITFDASARFSITGSDSIFIKGVAQSGLWSVGKNMIFLMNETGLRGHRHQIIDLRNGSLFLSGQGGALHTVYKQI